MSREVLNMGHTYILTLYEIHTQVSVTKLALHNLSTGERQWIFSRKEVGIKRSYRDADLHSEFVILNM